MLDGDEVGWRVICAQPALVVSEEHVENPVQAVLDGPVAAHDGGDEMGRDNQGGEVEACLVLGLAAKLAPAFDDHDTVQAGPAMALTQPGDIVDYRDVAGFNTPVIAIDRPVLADRGVLEPVGPLLGDEQLDIVP